MDDLVKRLRATPVYVREVMDEAAARIETLEAALREIARNDDGSGDCMHYGCDSPSLAKQALEAAK